MQGLFFKRTNLNGSWTNKEKDSEAFIILDLQVVKSKGSTFREMGMVANFINLIRK